MTAHLTLRRCEICDAWVAGYGIWEVEDACPITACARVMEIAAAEGAS